MPVRANIDTVISDLENRYDQVRHYTLDRNGPSFSRQRDQITEWLTAISRDITVLSAIRANLSAAEVIVTPPTSEDEMHLTAALNALSIPIQNNQAFNSFIVTVTGVLGAADTIAANVH